MDVKTPNLRVCRRTNLSSWRGGDFMGGWSGHTTHKGAMGRSKGSSLGSHAQWGLE